MADRRRRRLEIADRIAAMTPKEIVQTLTARSCSARIGTGDVTVDASFAAQLEQVAFGRTSNLILRRLRASGALEGCSSSRRRSCELISPLRQAQGRLSRPLRGASGRGRGAASGSARAQFALAVEG